MANNAVAAERLAGLMARLRTVLSSGRFAPGARLPPTRSLARMLQLSHTTVSDLLRRAEAEGLVVAVSPRIRCVADGSAVTAPARPLPAATVVILSGLPLDYPQASTYPFVQQVQVALNQALLAHQFNPFLMIGGAEQAHRAAALRPAACVVLDSALGTPPAVPAVVGPLLAAGIPVVLQSDRLPVGGDPVVGLAAVDERTARPRARGAEPARRQQPSFAPCDQVRCDHNAGAAALVHLLAGRGLRRLLALFPETPDPLPAWLSERLRGIRETSAALGLPEPLIVHLPQLNECHEPPRRFHRLVRLTAGFLHEHLAAPQHARNKSGRIQAILCPSDGEVAHTAAACRLLGHPPGPDLALVGFDDYWPAITERRFEPYQPLASVDRDGTHVGRALADLVALRQREPHAAARSRLIPPRLMPAR
jgi:DNA-binding LacI/PurR family transcriptional regulator